MFSICCLFLLSAIGVVKIGAIPIDNGVQGDPEIECGATGITVNFNTRNEFQGHVYVKGRFAEAGCRSDEKGRRVAGMTLPFAACGTERSRSLNPRGVFVTQNVVITFHPQFLTKVDRAYTIQCFYMEADKTVSQELEVSELTTAFQSQTVPMPVCRYDILDGGPTGQPIKFALIGQQVFHKWTCDTETTDIFCMIVHSCVVNDGAGNVANLLDDKGCGLDKHLLQNLEYTTDLMAGRESHVFKYADKPALFFSCQISITIKEPGAQCVRPQCGEPGGPGAGAVAAGATAGPARPAAAKVTNAPIPVKLTTNSPAAKPPTTPPPALAVVAAKVVALPPAVLVETNPPAATLKTDQPIVAIETASPTTVSTATTPPTTLTQAPSSGSTLTPPPAATSTPQIVSTATATTANGPTVAPTTKIVQSTTVDLQNDTDEIDFELRRKLRHVPQHRLDVLGVWDVKAQPITALDLSEDSSDWSSSLLSNNRRPLSDDPKIGQPESYCLSPVSFSFIVATTVVFGLLTGTLSTVLCLSRSRGKILE